jgi:outer membrane protein assembly factor BamB
LKCIDPATGGEKWAEKTGFGGLVAADGKLIVMNHRGKLSIVEASPNGCRTLAAAQVLGGKCWTAPTLSNGRIYCRSGQGDLVCLDVRGK